MPEAEFQVARCYLEGAGVPPSAIEGGALAGAGRRAGLCRGAVDAGGAVRAWRSGQRRAGRGQQASELAAGRPAAALFTQNEPAKPDFERAATWARKAADAGSADGQALLGYILTSGPEAMRDLEAAEAWYRQLGRRPIVRRAASAYGLALLRKAKAPEEFAEGAETVGRRRRGGAAAPRSICSACCTEQGQGVREGRRARRRPVSRRRPRRACARRRRAGALALMEGRGVARDPQAGECWLRRAGAGRRPRGGGDDRRHLCPRRRVAAQPRRGGDVVPPRRRGRPPRGRPRARHAAPDRRRRAARPRRGGALVPRLGRGRRHPGADTTSPRWCCRARRRRRIRCAPANGSSRPPPSGDLVAAYNYGICLAQGVGVERDDRRPRNGCAAPPRAWSMRSTGMAACWSRAAACRRTWRRAAPGSPAPPRPA